jgi:hypothetical protein
MRVNKTYVMFRCGGYAVAHVRQGARESALDPRLDLARHSPDGFEWGYHGSGPAQLALAILADAIGDDRRALELYQRFKRDIVAQMPQADAWELPQALVREIVQQMEREIENVDGV